MPCMSMSGWENYITNKPVDIMLDDAKEAELKVKEKNAYNTVSTCHGLSILSVSRLKVENLFEDMTRERKVQRKDFSWKS